MGSLCMRAFVRWLAMGLVCASIAHAEGKWRLAQDKDGVQVYLKPVSGSAYKAYRGVTTIQSDLGTLRALQEDVVDACAWIHQCMKQELLHIKGANAWSYIQFSSPWPVAPRDLVVKVTSRELEGGALRRELNGVPDYVAENEGFVRVTKVEGFWLFEPMGEGGVRVTYQMHTEPGGSVPSWLANKFVVEAPYNTLRDLRKRAEYR
ncbi:START domain-containing protein [Stutzerimonas stutzeri]|uniref:START domain-containing protein n=1 Tax=Stutzerimonas stutzeri TaxID=316 RepID=A0A0D9AQF7_STUST|nr:START domain-containing protein [Stutzerimonas stutzeri]KJH82924.1 hypothetical protein UF78_07755 [Stutzerimonas stutzeri]